MMTDLSSAYAEAMEEYREAVRDMDADDWNETDNHKYPIRQMLHDLWAYKSGSYDDHAHLGADYARKVLGELTTPEETEIICSAIYHHDSKAEVDAPMDEILKDADVIDHSLSDPTKEVKVHEKERYARLCAEMGLNE